MRLVLYILCLGILPCFGQRVVTLSSSDQTVALPPYLSVLSDTAGINELHKELKEGGFATTVSLANLHSTSHDFDQWLRFSVFNADDKNHQVYVNVVFTDFVDAFIVQDTGVQYYQTGDLLPLSQREIKVGQMCFINFEVATAKAVHCYVRVKSTTQISTQFREVTLKSAQLYTENSFKYNFETSRIYQALFYGAIFIMLFYNLFIYSTTLSISYLSYVKFLFCLILFMASNNGYIVELVLPNHPRLDLYLRFLSAPTLIFAYLLFARQYLEIKTYSLFLDKVLLVLLFVYIGIFLMMCLGAWKLGRTLSIETSILSFFYILYVAIVVMRRGFTPALYFLIANVLLILGGTLYAFERFNLVSHSPLTQYSVQFSVVFQSIFFSIGLADRIKLVTQQMAELEQEKEKLEKSREAERNKLIEEKNMALEKSNTELDTFIYKTAHDIRGPLARLMGLSNLGIMETQDERSLKYFGLLKNNAEYLNYLLERLSTAHEIKNQEVFLSNFQLKKLLQDVMSNLSFNEEYKNVSFIVQIENDATVHSDYGLTRFVLINLLDNAIKFRNKRDEGLSEVKIEAFSEANKLYLRIEDYGIGVNDEEFLFDMFSKAAKKFQTPGLGLYMSKLCIEKLKGTISLVSAGNPTVFQVCLPLE